MMKGKKKINGIYTLQGSMIISATKISTLKSISKTIDCANVEWAYG